MIPFGMFSHSGPSGRPIAAWLVMLAGIFGIGLSSINAPAQVSDRSTPTQAYHATFGLFYEGEYRSALERYMNEGRSAIKTSQSRWIDSICYETMCGECCYELGNLPKALDHYTAALKIYVLYSDWMIKVQFPAAIRPAGASIRRVIPWSTRPPQGQLGYYPTVMPIAQGQVNLSETVKQGGVVQQAVLFPIEVQEIVRCTTLAIRRRATILGPVAAHDQLFTDLINAYSRRPALPNHWSEAWLNVQYGLALAAGGRTTQALPLLQRSTLAAGEFAHPMSSIAHLELGRLAAVRGDYDLALKHFEEASYLAVYYPDMSVLEEAFRLGTITHLMANRKGLFPPLGPAISWAKSNKMRQLMASLLILASENHAVLGQTGQAVSLAEEARVTIGRRQMAAGRIGAQRNFVSALALFQQRKLTEGAAALDAAMTYMRQGSLWLFHISLSDNLYTSGASTPRTVMDLYQLVLRDPQPGDWVADPMESMAVLVTPHYPVFEHWFDVTVARKDYEGAMEVADRARRHRFFISLPLGGRLESLRWVLEGPTEALDKPAQLQRQDLLTRYPGYAQLQEQANGLKRQLAAMPLAPADADGVRKQSLLLGQWTTACQAQEAALREMAVRREPASMLFPPVRTTSQIQKSLPKGHAMLVFFASGPKLYGFLLNNERYAYWQVSQSTQAIGRQVVALLREMGNYQQNHEIPLKDLADPKWKQSAKDILDGLLKGSKADFTKKFEELVIVPDGVLWYLPFEALQIQADGNSGPLISRIRVRYAPTAALATATDSRAPKPTARTGVALGKLYPRQSEDAAQAAYNDLAAALPNCTALRAPLPGPSGVFATLLDRLIVLDDLPNPPDGGPYGWSPLPLDRGKSTGTLADWMSLPWGSPEAMVLPGFHTVAEESLKRVNRAAPGNEVFLTACGIMASGTRTCLLSRWRTGGQTSIDLVREFAQELPHTTAADAWQRAVLVVAAAPLNLEAEPRVKRSTTEVPPRANHPFFWSGYLLLDSGSGPTKVDAAPAAPAAPVLVPKKPEKADAAPAAPELEPKKPEKIDAAPGDPVLVPNKPEKADVAPVAPK